MMKIVTTLRLVSAVLVAVVLVGACGGDDGDNEADRLGIGAQCTSSDQCLQDGDAILQSCLTQFKGGYCGLRGCTSDLECPELSACVTHDDAMNYCFRTCVDKPECNENRDLENESNCSGSATFVDGTQGRKACIPPSSGV